MSADEVNSPAHYVRGGYELADVIEAFDLNHNRASAVEYLFRAGHKGGPEDELKDLGKALRRVQREIRLVERRLAAVPVSTPLSPAEANTDLDFLARIPFFAAASREDLLTVERLCWQGLVMPMPGHPTRYEITEAGRKLLASARPVKP